MLFRPYTHASFRCCEVSQPRLHANPAPTCLQTPTKTTGGASIGWASGQQPFPINKVNMSGYYIPFIEQVQQFSTLVLVTLKQTHQSTETHYSNVAFTLKLGLISFMQTAVTNSQQGAGSDGVDTAYEERTACTASRKQLSNARLTPQATSVHPS